jgi:hypothetical protein
VTQKFAEDSKCKSKLLPRNQRPQCSFQQRCEFEVALVQRCVHSGLTLDHSCFTRAQFETRVGAAIIFAIAFAVIEARGQY